LWIIASLAIAAVPLPGLIEDPTPARVVLEVAALLCGVIFAFLGVSLGGRK
jgi:hypothetical protein